MCLSVRVKVRIFLCALVSIGSVAQAAELISWWSFDQDAGDTIQDSIGSNHGTVTGGKSDWVVGKFGNGLNISGPNHYVEVAKSADLELDAVTLIAWVNIPTPGPRQEVASYADSYGIFAEATFKAFIFDGGGWAVLSGATPVEADTWHQVALTVDDAEMVLFVDGQLDGQLAVSPLAYQDFPMWFGGGPADNAFWLSGVLDEIEIWNDVLSEDEIMALFSQPPALAVEPSSASLTTMWAAVKSR